MRVTSTPAADAVVARAIREFGDGLSITIGTGCCESTAPFLYQDYWPGPDQAQVGSVAGVAVFAPAQLRSLYADDEPVVIDALDAVVESFSLETAFDQRLVLRNPDQVAAQAAVCPAPGPADAGRPDRGDTSRPKVRLPDHVVGEMPEALRGLRFR